MRMLHTCSAVLAAVLLLFTPAGANTVIPVDDYSNLVVPDSSPVHFASYNKDNLSATFDGSFVLTGTYELGYHVYHTPGQPDDGVYGFSFTVDPEIVATLPYWDRFPERSKEIDFDNFGDFLNAVVPKAELDQLQKQEVSSLKGGVSVRVDHYWTAKPCGYPVFQVHFLEVVKAPALVASGRTVEPRNC